MSLNAFYRIDSLENNPVVRSTNIVVSYRIDSLENIMVGLN